MSLRERQGMVDPYSIYDRDNDSFALSTYFWAVTNTSALKKSRRYLINYLQAAG